MGRQTFLSSHKEMPKATIEEQETIPPEADQPQEEQSVDIPEEPVEEEVPVPKKKVRIAAKASAAKASAAKASARKDAPRKTNLKDRHTCGVCGKERSLHTALYGPQNCPGKAVVPQPPAIVRQAAVPEEAPHESQMSQAQSLRLQLAHAAQERRAQAHMRMVTPIRSFYGL